MIRYNTTIGVYEVYTALGWAYAPLTYLQFSIDYLVVAGGGGGNGAVNDFTIAGGRRRRWISHRHWSIF
jgi:hypothetical protein